jgi:NTP pyrophosphatase (non-canonical NTP hydrolase)
VTHGWNNEFKHWRRNMNARTLTEISPLSLALPRAQQQVHEIAKSKGWWNNAPEDGTIIALMHSELSEALEALRRGNPESRKIPGFSHVEEELADVVIRIMDYSQAKGLNLGGAIMAKAQYNTGREHKHGGKEF